MYNRRYIKRFNKSIQLDEGYDNGKAYAKKAKIQFHVRHNYDSVFFYYRKAISFNSPYACNNYGSILSELGNKDSAMYYFSKAIQLENDYVIAYYNRGTAYKELDRYNEAIADLDKAIIFDNEFVEAYHNKGICFENRNDYFTAIDSYQRVLKIDSKMYNIRSMLWKSRGFRQGY